jgi:hypothetical protein
MKSVRFHELQTVFMLNNGIAERFENSKCDIENRWYSSRDIERFKDESKLVSKELRLFRKDRLLNGTVPTAGKNIFDAHQAEIKLIHWAVNVGMGRGLERWICPSQGLQRARERRKSILAVLRVQSLMVTRVEKDAFMEQIRTVSELCTENAKCFARLLGIADEAAASRCYTRHGRAIVIRQH